MRTVLMRTGGHRVTSTLIPPSPSTTLSATTSTTPTRLFHHELDKSSYARLGIARNRMDLAIAMSCTPSSASEDVENHLTHIAPALGLSRTKALQYVDIGLQIRRLPRLRRFISQRGQLPFSHLRTIANALIAVHTTDLLRELDEELVAFATPKVDGEVLRGVRSLNKLLQQVIEAREPLLRPRDFPGDKKSEKTSDGKSEETNAETEQTTLEATDREKFGEYINFREGFAATEILMSLDKTRAFEFNAILKAIASKTSCTLVEALSHLIHGSADFSVNLNLYCPLTEEKPKQAWLGGHGWLNEIASAAWLDRVTGVRMMTDETTNGYHPTASQRAYVQGRDGTCRHPDCSVDATKCDIDHIQPYNHEVPKSGGSTTTENLHCLCRRHHNLKTAGLWDISRYADGTEIWTSSTTGTTLISTESGPMAGHGRYSFNLRENRIGQTLTEHNEARLALFAQSKEATEQAREELNPPPF